ncbi:MAG: hypothetical protein M3322_05380, partial [Actinomycetota bacterium]|nr:hypothetical protein [Actinomycetota bacterium]
MLLDAVRRDPSDDVQRGRGGARFAALRGYLLSEAVIAPLSELPSDRVKTVRVSDDALQRRRIVGVICRISRSNGIGNVLPHAEEDRQQPRVQIPDILRRPHAPQAAEKPV